MRSPAELENLAIRWLNDDPDPATRAELAALLEKKDWRELADRFAGRLEFGTAGLRGVLGAGPNRMNRAVVRAASAGLCAYLEDTTEGAKERGIVIGYDGRTLSRELAIETAELAAARGFKVMLFDRVVPTPVCAFACTATGAAAGVMVTASHNPPEYNGYKVYWGNGAQIIPPHDEGIARAIEACGPLLSMPRMSIEDAARAGKLETLGDSMIDAYHAGVQRLLALDASAAPRDLVIAYTALHGVGAPHVARALATAGFEKLASVAEQAEPDAAFPTVRFPNPEEPGAMDLVMALAREVGADVVLANDPDADRLAVAARRGGELVMLTGNDIGCLLAHHLLEHGPKPPSGSDRRAVLSSVVSSPMLGAIALAHGAHWEQTLTGFKWIANRAMELEQLGYQFVCGYEEALGYTVGSLVRDKDGVSAALVIAELAAWCKSRGSTLLDELDLCARRYGLFLSRQVSLTMKGADGAARIRSLMDAVRRTPPAQIGAHAVLATSDYQERQRHVRGGAVEALTLPPSNAIALELDGGHRVMLRPSGTEPKIKFYVDLREVLGEKEPVQSAQARGQRMLESLTAAFLKYVEEIAPA